MNDSIDEKLKRLKNQVSLESLFSETEQKALAVKSIPERMETIVKSIFESAQKLGVSAEALKKGTNNYEMKADVKTGKSKVNRLSLIESMAKKVSKELEKKYKEAAKEENDLQNKRLTFSFPKGFINEVLKEPNKLTRQQMLSSALLPQLREQIPEDKIHEPFSKVFPNLKNMNLAGSGLNMKPGNGTVLETLSQMFEEVFETSRMKMADRMQARTVQLGTNAPQNEKTNAQKEKDEKPKDLISVSTDHINDMVLPGEQVELDQKNDGQNVEARHSDAGDGVNNAKKMTPEEELEMMQEMGLVPPWLRKN